MEGPPYALGVVLGLATSGGQQLVGAGAGDGAATAATAAAAAA